jgi:hypothetical protein
MDQSIPTETFKKIKPTLGDFDVQIPKEHRNKLNEFLRPGDTHGKFKVVHVRTHGNQTHAIVQHQETGKHHQIDFEPVEYDEKTQEPTQFEQIAHGSHFEDMKNGLKGVHHKYLLQSVLSAQSTPGIISSMKGRGKARAEVQEQGDYSPNTFSVDKGLRQKWEQVGHHESGLPIVREKKPADSEYTKDIPTIYKTMFGRHGSPEDHKDLESFDGLVNQIKKHIPQEHHRKIVRSFVNKLWHESAQASSIDPETDKKSKDAAYERLKLHFPKETSELEDRTNEKRSNYYDRNNPKYKFSKNNAVDDDTGNVKLEHHSTLLNRIRRILEK